MNCKFQAGQSVRRTNMMGRRSSDFRVAGAVLPVAERGGDYDVEYLHPGQGIMLTCLHDSAGESIEVRACVVNCDETKGTRRKVHGVQFLEGNHWSPTQPIQVNST